MAASIAGVIWRAVRLIVMNAGTNVSYLTEAVTLLEDVLRRSRRVFGKSHPDTKVTEDNLEIAKKRRAAAELLESRES